MNDKSLSAGCMIGLRVSPEADAPEWYTVWYEDDADQSRLVARDGRLQWVPTADAAREMAARLLDASDVTSIEAGGDLDIAEALHRVSSATDGDEGSLLVTINLLDDALTTVGDQPPTVTRQRLDRLCAMLTEGESVTACLTVLSQADLIEALLVSFGRLFVHSDFRV